MLRELAAHSAFDPAFAWMLNGSACDPARAWEDRRVAVLALEHQLLLADRDGFASALAAFGIDREPTELKARMMRLLPWHNAFRSGDKAGFLTLAAQECLLTLGRWFFRPDEVVARILSLVRTTAGAVDAVEDPPWWPAEIAAVTGSLPAYETEILAQLLARPLTWWTGPATTSTLNAMVEYPVGAAALTVRPPGSAIEFQIKRAGLRCPQPVKVIFSRDGAIVPASHRMQGVTSLSVLRWEGSNGALLAALFRRIHGIAAPTSTMVRRGPVKSVPLPDGGEASVAAWLSDPARFGAGFAEQDRAIAEAVAAFGVEYGRPAPIGGPLRERVRALLELAPPGQALLVGTAALRLDKIAAWLGPEGPTGYFVRPPTADEARQLADTLLREILGEYRPAVQNGDYHAYVDAAFAVSANRAAADRAYDAAVREIGRFWGTLQGLLGYTSGECFVPRNVGLKPVWQDGAWTPRIVFMDHEYTRIGGQRLEAHLAVPRMHHDWAHILGGRIARNHWPGCLAVLGQVYRIDAARAAMARSVLIAAMQTAYRRTRDAMRDDPFVRAHFTPAFVEDVLAWEGIVADYRAHHGAEAWPAALRRSLAARGIDRLEQVDRYRTAIERYGWWLTEHPYLFAADGGA